MNFHDTLARAHAAIELVKKAKSLTQSCVLQGQAFGYIQALRDEKSIDPDTYGQLVDQLNNTWDCVSATLCPSAQAPLDWAAFVVDQKFVGGERVDAASTPEGEHQVIGRLPVASFLESMDLTEDEFNSGARHAAELRRIYGPIPASREIALRITMTPGQQPVIDVLGWVSDVAIAHDMKAAATIH